MTENQNEEDLTEVNLEVKLRQSNVSAAQVKQVLLGHDPIILIEITESQSELRVDVDSTGPRTTEELRDFFAMILSLMEETPNEVTEHGAEA